MQPFRGQKRNTRKTQPAQKDYDHLVGVEVARGVIEWGDWNSKPYELTPAEIRALKGKSKRPSAKRMAKAIDIKRHMARGKSYSDIVRHYRGRRGFCPRTIWGIYNALSIANGQ